MPDPLPSPDDSTPPPPPVTTGHGVMGQYQLGQACVLVASGDLDANTTPALRQALDDAARAASVLVLDTRHVTFADSSFLTVLARAHQAGDFRVVGLPPSVLTILKITGLDMVLRRYDTVAAAVAVPPPRR
ncbi:STAS domain-containing protein [Streptomyces sp. NPDC091272]|uniref:STAS domain-containing protein n=1 Tax=Streptomyces sp. NPDC091272 TaxID=3365981 RepID=UPI0037F7D197